MDLKSYIYGIQPGRYGFQALFDRACKIFALMFLMLLSSEIRSQDVVYWRTEAINGNWEWGLDCTSAGTDGWWYYQTSGNGNRKRPDCSAQANIIHFNNANQLAMNLNDPFDFTANQVLFETGTGDRTIGTDAGKSLYFKQNNGNAKIENLAPVTTQTFDVKINIDAAAQMEINPVGGYLVFNNSIINASPNPILVWGNPGPAYTGDNVYFNGDISGTAGITINQNATVVYDVVQKTYTGPTTINAGTFLQIKSNQTLGDVYAYGTITVDAGVTLTITGTWTGGGTIVNNGTIVLAGSAAQSFPGSSTTVSAMNNLTINNASGVLLDKSINVDGTLTLSSGRLSLGSNDLILGASSPAIAGTLSAANMVVADGSGQLRKVFTATGSYVFPVGDATGTPEYSPITLSFTSGTFTGAYAAVRVINAKHPDNASTSNYLSRYWALTGSGISSFSYAVNAELPATDITGSAANMSVGRWGGSLPWVKNGTVTSTTLSTTGLTAFGDITGLGAAPTVTISANPSLTVCQNSGVVLTANASGDPDFTYLWSTGATTQSITPATATAGSTTYTVTVTDINGSINSAGATVVVNATPAAPTGTAAQTFCSGTFPTIASLSATGTNIQWYNVSSGGIALPTSTALVTATYYASQTVNGCESTNRLAVDVTVNPTPPAPEGVATQFFCSSPVPKVSNLAATGTNIKWYNAVSGGTLLTAGTNLVTSNDYYASQTVDGCESTSRLKVRVTIITTPPATSAISGSASPCPATSLTYSVTAKTGTTFTWSIPDDWTAVSALSGFGVNSITVISGTAGTSGTIKVVAVNTCLTDSSLLTVSVTTPPAVSINANYCVGGGNIQLIASPGSSPAYSYQWTRNGTNYATSQAITVNIAAIYAVKVTEASTTCFATATTTLSTELVKNGNFNLGNQYIESDYTYQPYVTGDTSLHYPEGKYAVDYDPHLYHKYFWGRDHTSNTGNFMILNGVPTSVAWKQTIDNLVPGTKYYFSAWAISLNASTPFAQLQFRVNGTLVGTVLTLSARTQQDDPPYNWLQFYGDWTAPAGTTSALLEIVDLQTATKGNDFGLDDISFGTLSPTLMTLTASANGGDPVCEGGNIDLSVQINGGRPPYTFTWTGPNGPIPGVQYPSISGVTPADNGTYTVVINDSYGCGAVTASTTVSVLTKPTASLGGTATLCKDPSQTRNITFTGAGSTPDYKFMYTLNGVADSISTTSGNSSITVPVPATIAGDFTYTLTKVISSNGCSQLQTSAATIAVREVTAAISGTTSVCNGAPAPDVTFTASGWRASPPFTFTYRINGGANLTVNANSGNCVSISAPTGVSGTFVYELISVSGASGCSSPASGTAIITIYPTPTVTGTNSACVNQNGIVYTTEPGMSNYAWTVSGGTIITGQGTNSISVNWGAQGAQSIGLNYTNTYGCAAATPTSYAVYVGDMWIGVTPDWNLSTNWCYGVPTAAQDVVIPGSAAVQPQIMSAAAVCHDLVLNGASASLQINAGQTLTINGNLVNNGGNLTINSDALDNNGSLIVEGAGTGTGSVTYKRYLEPDRWFISSPSLNNGFSYTGSTIAAAGDGTYDFAPFNEGTNNWDYINPMPTTLNPGLGYLLRLSTGNYVQYFGSLNGDISKSLPSTSSYTGWNAAGNPYTSAIRIKDEGSYLGFISQNAAALDANYRAVYIWNQTGSYSGAEQFYTVIANTGYSGKIYQGLLSDNYVQAGQGFLVNLRYSGGTPATVIFRKGTVDNGALDGMQVHSTGTSLKRAETSWPGITLLATTGGRTRSTVVAFSPDMTTGLDPSYDAGLLSVSDFNLYTRLVAGNNETNFAIQSLPDNDYQSMEVPVGLDMPQAGQITFKADGIILPDGIYPVIEDRLTHAHVALKTLNDSLTASLEEPSWGTGRFFLHFGNTSTLDINDQRQVQLFTAFYSSQEIILLGIPEAGSHAWLYDVNGRKLGGKYLLTSINKNIIPAQGLANGIYLLRIEGKTTQQTLKVTVLNR